jgi:hydroxymethylglutaryl-CoA synthase
MVGIVSYGAYIPWYRLSREEFLRAWGGFAIPGERSVANYDEDSLTMAVEASVDCLADTDAGTVDGFIFATTTAPYTEKQGSAIMALALDLRRDVRTADMTNSLRAGAAGMAWAKDAIEAGSLSKVLVAASDCRLAAPSSMLEQVLGDGAAAMLLGKDDLIATIEGSHSISDEFAGLWRASTDTFLRTWEERMVLDEGYSRVLPEAIAGVMKKYGLTPKDFAKLVLDLPTDLRRHGRVATQTGFQTAQLQDGTSLFLSVGDTGAASGMMGLVAALEDAKPGDRILLASYGNGADAIILQVTKGIAKLGPRRGMKNHLASKKMLANYEKYLKWRSLVAEALPQGPGRGLISLSAMHRDSRILIGGYGKKCLRCGTPQFFQGGVGYPPIRVCIACQAKDQFEDYRFAGRKGVLFSFTQDNLIPAMDPPAAVGVVDFDGGGRAFLDLTDRDVDKMEVGMRVELTLRKLFFEQGIHNYFWKIRPVRC